MSRTFDVYGRFPEERTDFPPILGCQLDDGSWQDANVDYI